MERYVFDETSSLAPREIKNSRSHPIKYFVTVYGCQKVGLVTRAKQKIPFYPVFFDRKRNVWCGFIRFKACKEVQTRYEERSTNRKWKIIETGCFAIPANSDLLKILLERRDGSKIRSKIIVNCDGKLEEI